MTNDMPPILSVDNLSISFLHDNALQPVVKNVSLNLYKGETLALVGESGSGKSVTAHALLKLLPKHSARYPSGRIIYNNKDLIKTSDTDMQRIRGNRIGMIFQEPMTALNPLHNVEKQISESLYLHGGFNKTQTRQRVLELLALVGIHNPDTKLLAYPHELSGGQRQRVMIAMALANEPDILIADEPTTALDVTIQKQVLNLLQSLQQKMGMAMLLITHDLGIVKRYAHRVAVMQQGSLVESNNTESLFANPQHDYTKLLLNSTPSGSPCPITNHSPPLLEAKDIKVWFPLTKGIFKRTAEFVKAIDGVNISLKRGQTLGIVGESGSGKTTLIHALLRLSKSKGSILFKGQSIEHLNQRQLRPLRRAMQIVFQDPFGSLSPRMSIAEIIEEGLLIHSSDTKKQRDETVINALCEVGLDPSTRHRYPHEFSGGQRQRVAIARALVLKPDLIILDEPTSALDRSVQSQVMDLLRKLQKDHGFGYIFISHDLKVVKTIAHDVMVLKNGVVVEQGSSEQIFESAKNEYTQELLSAALNL